MESLYNIQSELIEMFNTIEENDGEITDEQYNALVIKEEELKDKLYNYYKAIQSWKGDEECCKNEKRRINDVQNKYKNRIERLKNVMLTAVQQFGEEGKSGNRFIELPTVRLFTRASKSIEIDEERINIFCKDMRDIIEELNANDVLSTGGEFDAIGLLDVLNAHCKAEYGDDFEPFTERDLYNIKVNIHTTDTFGHLFENNPKVLGSIGESVRTDIDSASDKDHFKSLFSSKIETTCAKEVYNNSLQIK